jgi:hypothetical protein
MEINHYDQNTKDEAIQRFVNGENSEKIAE